MIEKLFIGCLFVFTVSFFFSCEPSRLIEPIPGAITGMITLNDGVDPSGIRVGVVGTDKEDITANDGSFIIEDVLPGTHTIRASRADYEEERQSVRVTFGMTTDIRIWTLHRLRDTITGTVILDDEASGRYSNINIKVEGQSLSTTTDKDGSYTIPDVPVGLHVMLVSKRFYIPQGQMVTVEANTGAVVDSITLERGTGTVEGTVHLEGQTDHSGINIDVQGIDSFSALTDRDGNFMISAIPAGEQTITISKSRYNEESHDVTVDWDSVSTIGSPSPIMLSPATGSISGRVTLEDTDDASGVVVEIEGTGISITITEISGVFTIPNVPVGNQDLIASKTGYMDSKLTVLVSADITTSGQNLTLISNP